MANHNIIMICVLMISIILASNVIIAGAQNKSVNSTNLVKRIPATKNNDFAPNIDAASIYENKTMVLGSYVKNLVILIPNEAHEPPGLEEELRVINQPYVPQNVIVQVNPTGTIVTWFNTDIPHDHRVRAVDENSDNVFDSDIIKFNTPSNQLTLTEHGNKITISEEGINEEYPEFVMNGTITVVNQEQSKTSENTTSVNYDTVTTYILPANELDKRISEFKDLGFNITSTYPFKSLRGSGSEAGGDKNQFLLVLTSFGKGLDEVISGLKKVTDTMPYT